MAKASRKSHAGATMGLWERCDGVQHIQAIHGRLWRLVESQEQIATRSYVDTLDEQLVLEQLLDTSKPPLPDAAAGYHYLLQSPFRYPPLPWGSRFGQRHEPGIFYGGGSVETTLVESAYYRLVFWHAMAPRPDAPPIVSEHTLFAAHYRSNHGVRLHQPPFDAHGAALRDPLDYGASQQLGSAMRRAGVQAFEYASARDSQAGRCVGLFTPQALISKKPVASSRWLCETTADAVVFKPLAEARLYRYAMPQFEVNGRLPLPAA